MSGHEHTHDHNHDHDHGDQPARLQNPVTAQEWDELYETSEKLWTSNVNPALIAETADLTPGFAFDLGSGEGADVRWLADRGWYVVGADISKVALERAGAIDSRETIQWRQFDVTSDKFDRQYDLITASYFHIPTTDAAVVVALGDAVAPGGTLLIVMHDREGMREHGRDVDAFLWPESIIELLGDGWEIVTNEVRDRGIPAGGGHHVDDVVLRVKKS